MKRKLRKYYRKNKHNIKPILIFSLLTILLIIFRKIEFVQFLYLGILIFLKKW